MAGFAKSEDSLKELLQQLEESSAQELDFEQMRQALRLKNHADLTKLSEADAKKLMQLEAEGLEKLEAKREQYRIEQAALARDLALANIAEEDYAAREAIEARYNDEVKRAEDAYKKSQQRDKKGRTATAKQAEKDRKKTAKQQEADDKKRIQNQIKNQGLFAKDENGHSGISNMFHKTNADGTRELDVGKGLQMALGGMAGKAAQAAVDFAAKLDSTIDEIAGKKSAIDTRLQGLTTAETKNGSIWEKMSTNITSMAGASALVKQEDIANKISEMVGKGIAFNVEQRAVLDVMKDKIATTFDANNGTLRRLIRIQEQDTTAGRLGMESALTSFLNNMYETTEYMSELAESVKGSLEESMALMTGKSAVAFEYQVQKWLGSMYSTGMNSSSVQSISSALGNLAAGKLDDLSGSGVGNLLIMAANQAGMNISDILSEGLNDKTTNQLMESMVDYLAKIYDQAGDSKVIQQQFASVYGLSASDLKAMVSLAKSSSKVATNGLTYDTAMRQLNSMAASMTSRTSTGEMLSNVEGNLKYSLANGIASTPAMYGIYKGAKMLKDITGGIALPAISVMGSGVDLETTVADLMMTGAMAGGLMSNIGMFGSAISNAVGGGSALLKAAGVSNKMTTVSRGSGSGLATAGGMTTSSSGSVAGNAAGDDIKNATLTDANDSANSQLASAKDESTDATMNDVNDNIINIFNLLTRMMDDGLPVISNASTNLTVTMSQSTINDLKFAMGGNG